MPSGQKKQEALETEIAVLKSTQKTQMQKAKRVDEFSRKQAALNQDLAQQRTEVAGRRQQLERLRRSIVRNASPDNRKPDKGKAPEFPRRSYPDDNPPNDDGDDNDDDGDDGDSPDDYDRFDDDRSSI